MTNKFKFTLARLRALKPADKRYVVYDTETPALRMVVHPTGGKTFEVVKKPTGSKKPVTVRICRLNELPLDGDDGVRARAMGVLAKLLKGENPNLTKKIRAAQIAVDALTLKDALTDYLKAAQARNPAAKKKPLKHSTATGYRRNIEKHFKDWLNLPLRMIDGNMVIERHRKIAVESPVAANNAVRIIQIIFGYYGHTPMFVDRGGREIPLSKELSDHLSVEAPRTGFIEDDDMPAWWKGTESVTETQCDYLRFLLLTGLRRNEGAGLLWSNVDLDDKTFLVMDTKNHTDFRLPLSDFTFDMLERRYKSRNGDRVFPLSTNKEFVQKVRDASGVQFTLHDLRRTYATAIEELDIGMNKAKAMLNHKLMKSNNVTENYIQVTTAKLRDPVQRVSDYFLSVAKVRDSVVSLDGASDGAK